VLFRLVCFCSFIFLVGNCLAFVRVFLLTILKVSFLLIAACLFRFFPGWFMLVLLRTLLVFPRLKVFVPILSSIFTHRSISYPQQLPTPTSTTPSIHPSPPSSPPIPPPLLTSFSSQHPSPSQLSSFVIPQLCFS
jgi:hypothetical protein